jgi:lipopolysaccharide transport system ATP-binding protein
MGDWAIRAEGLGKRYRLGERQPYKALRDIMAETLIAPVRAASSLALGQPSSNGRDPDASIWALKNVSFEIKRGEVVGVIGANGAGKSTLLKVLSRITEPTEGFARIKGRVGSLLEVGTGFHPELTGRENIFLNGAILGMRKAEIERRFDEIVAFAEMERFLDTPVKHYSSGMFVRLAFAVAAHLDTEILLVDEVLAVGDAAFQKKSLGKMGQVAEGGRTVLFVSHNMTAVQSLCQKAIWIEEGSVKEYGLAQEVVGDYLDSVTLFDEPIEYRWPNPTIAPRSDEVALSQIYVQSPSITRGKSKPSINEPLKIGVDFWSLLSNQNLAVTIHVLSFDGSVAFSTSTGFLSKLRDIQLSQGHYRAECRVPANLLNSGRHSLRLLVVKDQARVILTVDDALAFEMRDCPERRGAYFGKEPGVVAPLLDWHLYELEQDVNDDGI